jgi:hypothetical protein
VRVQVRMRIAVMQTGIPTLSATRGMLLDRCDMFLVPPTDHWEGLEDHAHGN